jgi:hypothetical protein
VTEIVPAEGIFALLWVIIALPAAGAAILLFAGRRTNSWGPILGVLTVVASAADMRSLATIDGLSTTTLPLCIIRVLAVPRSIAISSVKKSKKAILY